MDMLKDLMKKKGKQDDMDPTYKTAKMGVLKHISDMASGAMGDDIKGIKKVEVAAKDREGLEDGLHVAEKLVGKRDKKLDSNEFDETSETAEDDAMESPQHEAEESSELQELEHEKGKDKPVVKEHGGHAGMREALAGMGKDPSPAEAEHSMLPDDMSDDEMDALMAEISKKRSKK
jgi:hypothetical protein